MTTRLVTETHRVTPGPIHTDVRAFLVAIVVGSAVVDASFALRWGAVACVLVVVSRIAVYRPTRLDYAVLALGAAPTLSYTWTVSTTDTLLAMQNYIGFAAIFLGVRAAVVDRRSLILIARGHLAGCIFAATQIVLEAGTFRYGFDTGAERLGLDVARGAGTNYLAYAFVVGLAVIVLVWSTTRPAMLGRLTLLAIAALLWLGIVQTGTRGAVVGIVMFVVWIMVQKAFPGRGLAALWGVAVGLNALILTGLADGTLAGLSGSSSRDTGTLNGRLEMWPAAREVFYDHPLNGVGADAFIKINPLQAGAHNALLDLGTGLGILGVGLFVFIIWRALIVGPRALTPRRRALLIGSLLATVTASVSTGYWIEAPTLWALLAMFSRLEILQGEGPRTDGSRSRRTVEDPQGSSPLPLC